jgi:glycosyltransferase involved in cell wall biosynthesis
LQSVELSERPRLSVVIACVNGADYLDACLAALARQGGGVRAEVVVADRCGEGTRALIARKYPDVRLLSYAERLTIPHLRAIGIAHSRGDLVAVTEDHCVPAEDWYERIVAAHQSPYGAVGGAVENASTRRLVDWAVFLCEYHRHVSPIARGVVDDIPGMNAAYKREALAHLEDLLAAGRWESFLHARLRQVGFQLYADPSVLVYHRKFFGVTEFLQQRFHYGRAFAGMRVDRAAIWRRGFFVVGSLGLPPLLIGRIATCLFARRRHRLIFLRTLPLLILFTLSWAAGECLGYLAGPGDSLVKVE